MKHFSDTRSSSFPFIFGKIISPVPLLKAHLLLSPSRRCTFQPERYRERVSGKERIEKRTPSVRAKVHFIPLLRKVYLAPQNSTPNCILFSVSFIVVDGFAYYCIQYTTYVCLFTQQDWENREENENAGQ